MIENERTKYGEKEIFENYEDAALKLAEILPEKDFKKDNWLLTCISMDGVYMTDLLARKLKIYYQMLFTEVINPPNNQECKIAMVSETEEIVIDTRLSESFNISIDYIYGEAHRKYEEKILKNVYQCRKGDLIGSLKDKNVLLIDSGCETGMTALVCIKTVINAGAKSVAYATPVIPLDVATELSALTDEIYSIHRILNFVDADFYYKHTEKLDQENIKAILEESPYYLPLQKNTGE